MNKTYIGIDPGLQGGICILTQIDKGIKVDFLDIPREKEDKKEIDIKALYDIFISQNKPVLIGVEQQHAFPGQGIVSNSRIVGEFKTILTVAIIAKHLNEGIEVLKVSAREWQKHMYNKKWSKDLKKKRSLMAYEKLGLGPAPTGGGRRKKPHLGYVDAALIAYYLFAKNTKEGSYE